MFNKLLKYEVKSIFRYWWLIAVSVVGLSFLGAFALRFTLTVSQYNTEFRFISAIATLATILIIFCIFASVQVTQILIFVRYYKNFFTDEGYLTFTLPVSRQKMLAAKMLNGMIWTLAHILLLILCAVFIFGIISPLPEKGNGFFNFEIFKIIGNLFSEGWKEIGWWLIVYIAEIIALTVMSLAFSQALLYFCITFGSVIAKKAKLLAAIGIYYVINFVLSLITRIFGSIATIFLVDGFYALFPSDSLLATNGCLTLILLIIISAVAALAALAYFTTQTLIQRKLNLP